MKFTESLGDFTRRVHNGGRRKPLRTFKELCEELGVSMGQMKAYLRRPDAPTPAIYRHGQIKNTWYKPEEFRAWFKKIKKGDPNE